MAKSPQSDLSTLQSMVEILTLTDLDVEGATPASVASETESFSDSPNGRALNFEMGQSPRRQYVNAKHLNPTNANIIHLNQANAKHLKTKMQTMRKRNQMTNPIK